MGLALLVDDPNEGSQGRRFDPGLLLVFAGIILVFVAFLSAAFWDADHAVWFLAGGIVVLALGFVFASRSD